MSAFIFNELTLGQVSGIKARSDAYVNATNDIVEGLITSVEHLIITVKAIPVAIQEHNKQVAQLGR